MIKKIQTSLALSENGAKGLVKGSLYNALYYMTLMLPMSILSLFLSDVLSTNESPERIVFRYTLYAGIAVVAIVLSSLFYYLQYSNVFIVTYRESEAKRLRLGEKLRKLPLAFFSNKDLADLTNTIMQDVNTLENFVSHSLPQLIGSIISTCFIILAMLIWDWRMGLALAWIMPVVLLIIILSGRFQTKHVQSHFNIKRVVSDQIQENIEHMPDIMSNNLAEQFTSEYKELLEKEEKSHRLSEIAMSVFVNGGQALLKIGFATTVILGTAFLENGEITLLKYLLYLIAAARVYDPIGGVVFNLSYLYYALVPIKRSKTIESEPEMTGVQGINFDSYELKFEDVHFNYLADTPVLKGISFTAPQGQITALIGPSGCGKSTISKLATRFYDPVQGRVLIGGKDLRLIDPEEIMQKMSMVFQDVVLFDNTVMENIRIGRKEASDEEVLAVARLANCDFVENLPQGFQTRIGENGARLSGGERQRISIARALLKDAPILLLDEATASLDASNESEIQAAINRLVKGKTVLMIAHRMRTVENVDQIIALESGEIVESGSPKQLWLKSGLYHKMYNLQTEPN
ncbi:MAG: ABC transporter ATP-binding protein [Clostridiaceae bacterium]|nr:ABC transporter ATP-binding protein [Clostridiaceae bacterium]